MTELYNMYITLLCKGILIKEHLKKIYVVDTKLIFKICL